MRVAFFAVLLANLLFLAWAGWIDAPRKNPPPAQDARIPQLMLADEVRAGAVPPEARTAPRAMETSMTLASARPPSRCVSVGPFSDLPKAARAAALLRERGFDPRPRAVEGERLEGFWVYIGGLQSAAEVRQVLRTLERNGVADAHAMPESAEGRRVSVGLFSERERAERRAQAVQKLGLRPEIRERRQAGTFYWVDVDLGPGERAVPTGDLATLEGGEARLEIRGCPADDAPGIPPDDVLPELPPAPTTTADAGPPRPA